MPPVSEDPALKPPFDDTVLIHDAATRSLTRTTRPDQSLNITTNQTSGPAISQAQRRGTSLFHPLLPASYRDDNRKHKPQIVKATSHQVQKDLSVERLNAIHNWLWLAGRPMPPRPLNYQVANGREIIANEDMGMHLVWAIPRRIFLKPIPRYLLDYDFWKTELIMQEHHLSQDILKIPEDPIGQENLMNQSPYRCALGFLLSYTALIQYESDFHIAKDKHLIPEGLEWESWIKLVHQLLHHENLKLNKRYQYGELRLSRLNKIYWARFQLRGYHFLYQSYEEMFQANIAPIAGTIVYIGLVLTAMQVGLATHRLSNSHAFQNASYAFTIFSILAPIILIFLVLLLLLIFFIYNWITTEIFRRRVFRSRH